MARASLRQRLHEVAESSCRVFIDKGYRRTLVSDVAEELGLSQGAVYGYVESKEALFHLAMVFAVAADRIAELPIPVPTPPPGGTLALLRGWAPSSGFPILAQALKRRRRADVRAELTAIIDERYQLLEDNQRLLSLIERSAQDLPDLSALYFQHWRRDQISDLALYLGRRISSGELRPVPDVPIAARFVVETIAWFAWHRQRDPDSAMIGDAEAHATVTDLLLAAFVPEPPPTIKSGSRR
ncbi:MAG TPA: helix-turn-helix domain-containing protein [Acidimicrobiales bacterium]|jgi:AcrR family transcriptional regulator